MHTNTTIESIMHSATFGERVGALRVAAGAFNDPLQVAICLLAEEGTPAEGVRDRFCGLDLDARELARLDAMTQDDAIRECARVILEGEAQVTP